MGTINRCNGLLTEVILFYNCGESICGILPLLLLWYYNNNQANEWGKKYHDY